MPQIVVPDQTTIDGWQVTEIGSRDFTSPVERFEVNNSTTERRFRVNWDTRNEFVWWMLGYSQTWDDGGTTRLSRLLPQVHPLYPDLVATRVPQIKGWKWIGNEEPDVDDEYVYNSDQIQTFLKADVTVMYEHVTYDRVEDDDIYSGMTEFDRYVIRGEVTPGADYLQLPGAAFAYRTAGATPPHNVPVAFNSGRILPQERFTLTWHRLPEDVWTPDSGLYDFVYGLGSYSSGGAYGAVNKTTFYGRPPGTVLLEAVRPILMKSPLGIGLEWDLEYTFAYNPRGWNYVYYFDLSGANSGWYFVSSTGYEAPGSVTDDTSIYNERELNDLFSVNM